MRRLRQIEQHLTDVQFLGDSTTRMEFAMNLGGVFTIEAVESLDIITLTSMHAMQSQLPILEQVTLAINAMAPTVLAYSKRKKVH